MRKPRKFDWNTDVFVVVVISIMYIVATFADVMKGWLHA